MRHLDIASSSSHRGLIDLRASRKQSYTTIRTHHPHTRQPSEGAVPSSVSTPTPPEPVRPIVLPPVAPPVERPAIPERPLPTSKKESIKDLWDERRPDQTATASGGTPPKAVAEQIFSDETTTPKPVQVFPKQKVKSQKKLVLAIKTVISILVIFLLIGTALFGRAFFTGANIFNKEGTSPLDQIKHLVLSSDRALQGETDGRVNVLLLGMGGEGHDGALLTDTIMILSIKPATKEMAMISLPRDLWVKTDKFGYSKLNKVNFYGETEVGKDEGPKYTRDAVQEITGLNIPYYVRIDFSGFEDIVNSIGGVEVDVENGFIDKEYPTDDYGYQTVKFDRGRQHLDGDAALKYARSRHGVITEHDPESSVKDEASDFARSRRQQKLISAIKDKALTTGVLANPQKLNSLFEALGKHIVTNAQMWEGVRLFELARDFQFNHVKINVISNEKYLKVYTTPDGAYTLIPVDGFGQYGKIQELALNTFDQSVEPDGSTEISVPTGEAPAAERASGYEEAAPQEQVAPAQKEATASIAIQNGTTANGIGAKTGNELRNSGYTIVAVGNAADQTRQNTVIYDNTHGQKSEQLKAIAAQFEADIIDQAAPANKAGVKESADFVLILGTESTR